MSLASSIIENSFECLCGVAEAQQATVWLNEFDLPTRATSTMPVVEAKIAVVAWEQPNNKEKNCWLSRESLLLLLLLKSH